MMNVYKSLVRLHLDYRVAAWSPYLMKDIGKIEEAQCRATELIDECKGLRYDNHLVKLHLTPLETKRK